MYAQDMLSAEMFHFVNNSVTGQGSSSEWDHLGRLDGVVRQSVTVGADGTTTAASVTEHPTTTAGGGSGGERLSSPGIRANAGSSPNPLATGPAAARAAMLEMDNEILAAFRGGGFVATGAGTGGGAGGGGRVGGEPTLTGATAGGGNDREGERMGVNDAAAALGGKIRYATSLSPDRLIVSP